VLAANNPGVAMKGNVIGFDPDTNTGAISGHDGKRYDFVTADWRGRSRPHRNDVVDFAPDGERATEIYLLEPEYVAPSFGAFYFSLSGRISRSQYWLRFYLPIFIISIILNIISVVGGTHFTILPTLFQIIVLWPGIAILVKRIHDRNKSGSLIWFLYGPAILALIFTIAAIIGLAASSAGAASVLGVVAGILWIGVTGVAIWFFIEFGCMRGTIGSNRYGPDPVRAG
jgi:uncharacterized membrane protein YhaH (DUF805 family)